MKICEWTFNFKHCASCFGFSGKNVRSSGDLVDAAKSSGDVADSPTGMSAKSSHFRPQIQHFSSIEDEFQYDMRHKERGCFVIFNQEVGEHVSNIG